MPEDTSIETIETMPEGAVEESLEEDTHDDTVPEAVPESVDEEVAEVDETPVVESTEESVEEPPAMTPITVTEHPPTEAIKGPALEDTEGDLEHENLMPDEQQIEGRLPMYIKAAPERRNTKIIARLFVML